MSVLFENEFNKIEMVNENYPFTINKKQGIVIVPYDRDGNVYMLHKTRQNQFTSFEGYEFPRGFADTIDEVKVFEVFKRYHQDIEKVIDLGIVQPDNGVMDNPVQVYGVLVPSQIDENIVMYKENVLFKHILLGKITDGYTLSAMMKFIAFKQQ